MIVLVDLKEGVSPEDYERWVRETYRPAVMTLSSIERWRGYRASALLGSEAAPPHQYVVVVEIEDLEQLGRDMTDETLQALLSQLHAFADITQIMADRFA